MTATGLSGPADLGLTGERTLPGSWQVATEPGAWDQDLRAVVTAVTAADFVVGDPGECLDLVVVGVRR